MSAIAKHTEEINERCLENMNKLRNKNNHHQEVFRVFVEPKINPCDFTFFINQSNQHTYSYTC